MMCGLHRICRLQQLALIADDNRLRRLIYISRNEYIIPIYRYGEYGAGVIKIACHLAFRTYCVNNILVGIEKIEFHVSNADLFTRMEVIELDFIKRGGLFDISVHLFRFRSNSGKKTVVGINGGKIVHHSLDGYLRAVGAEEQAEAGKVILMSVGDYPSGDAYLGGRCNAPNVTKS